MQDYSFQTCLSIHPRGILTQLLRYFGGWLSMKRSMLASPPQSYCRDRRELIRAGQKRCS